MSSRSFRLAKKQGGYLYGCGPAYQSKQEAKDAASALNAERAVRRQIAVTYIIEVVPEGAGLVKQSNKIVASWKL